MSDFELIEFERAETPDLRPARDDCLVAAQTDVELATTFLDLKPLAQATRKSTITELSRFLWWLNDRQLRMAQVKVETMQAYRNFLLDPQPRDRWVSQPKFREGDDGYDPENPGVGIKWPRDDPHWRPFSKPLSEASARQAFRVAKALMAFAQSTGYVRLDAGAMVANYKVSKIGKIERYLGKDTIAYIDAYLDAMPVENRQQIRLAARDRFLFLAFVTTGARLSEIAKAQMRSVRPDSNGRCWLTVVGKGSKPRDLPVCDELLDAFRNYRLAFGLDADPRSDAHAYALVLSVRRNACVGVGMEATADAITNLFGQAAGLARADRNIQAAETLEEASAHWLRHELITDLVNFTGDVTIGRDQAGHASIATTSVYLHSGRDKRHDQVIAMAAARKARR